MPICVQSLLSNESLASTPFLILGNKIDIPRAASEGAWCEATCAVRDWLPVGRYRPLDAQTTRCLPPGRLTVHCSLLQ